MLGHLVSNGSEYRQAYVHKPMLPAFLRVLAALFGRK